MWHGPEAVGGPLLQVHSQTTIAGMACVGFGTLPLDTAMKLKYDTKLNSRFLKRLLAQ